MTTLDCDICASPFIDPVTITTCGHSFCDFCLTKSLLYCSSCPSCGVTIDQEDPLAVRADPFLRETLARMAPSVLAHEIKLRDSTIGIAAEREILMDKEMLLLQEGIVMPRETVSLVVEFARLNGPVPEERTDYRTAASKKKPSRKRKSDENERERKRRSGSGGAAPPAKKIVRRVDEVSLFLKAAFEKRQAELREAKERKEGVKEEEGEVERESPSTSRGLPNVKEKDTEDGKARSYITFRRFFSCKGCVPIRVLRKLFSDKMVLPQGMAVFFMNHDATEFYDDSRLVGDIATERGWRRRRPLRLLFTIVPTTDEAFAFNEDEMPQLEMEERTPPPSDVLPPGVSSLLTPSSPSSSTVLPPSSFPFSASGPMRLCPPASTVTPPGGGLFPPGPAGHIFMTPTGMSPVAVTAPPPQWQPPPQPQPGPAPNPDQPQPPSPKKRRSPKKLQPQVAAPAPAPQLESQTHPVSGAAPPTARATGPPPQLGPQGPLWQLLAPPPGAFIHPQQMVFMNQAATAAAAGQPMGMNLMPSPLQLNPAQMRMFMQQLQQRAAAAAVATGAGPGSGGQLPGGQLPGGQLHFIPVSSIQMAAHMHQIHAARMAAGAGGPFGPNQGPKRTPAPPQNPPGAALPPASESQEPQTQTTERGIE